ncbi:hypothetical protein PAXRUDRAFT_464945 [Paxillus rubicundulus Ve08.2h10]|uniref:Uncharacterized protein n=1 Tax=Paxillus rubicundulus Ve08.2h10 TaxID=930991 RepID=A0A0D0ECN6_9AGAM|nr:hypothetical protein PAXRUDRAFT_464945 [Paxillus rubicundulus Ve08.2h10]
MFSSIHATIPSDADIANQILKEESGYRLPSFSASDAVTLGLSLRKRFRASSRHGKGKGMVISIQTIAGHTLFSCTAGDLGHHSGEGDVSLESWACLESMIAVVKRTSHSSYYVEKGMSAMGKTAKQTGTEGEFTIRGGAFPIWLDNAPCCPIAIIACYSGSSQEDHKLVSTTVRDFLHKKQKESTNSRLSISSSMPLTEMPVPTLANQENRDSFAAWGAELAAGHMRPQPPFEDEHDD